MKRTTPGPIAALCLVMAACASGNSPAPDAPTPAERAPGAAPLDDAPDATSRRQLTAQECEASQGAVVGDIGDGAIHRPDYTCPSGMKPIGSIVPAAGEPMAVEGSVCCPQ